MRRPVGVVRSTRVKRSFGHGSKQADGLPLLHVLGSGRRVDPPRAPDDASGAERAALGSREPFPEHPSNAMLMMSAELARRRSRGACSIDRE